MQAPISSSIPTSPGVYLYKDKSKKIIYVGKARILRNRVLSYFRSQDKLPIKTVAMISHAVSIEYITTNTEKEALLLESSLIKKHRPHYNIDLRDDKHYVLFRLDTKQDFPKLEIVRRIKKDKAKYFGPYVSSAQARSTHKYLLKIFPLRRCQDSNFKNRVRPCLYFDIGQCSAPCCKKIDREEYHKMLQKISLFLNGRSQELIRNLEKEMQEEAEQLNFETAAILRDQLAAINKTVEQQSVVLYSLEDLDIIGITELTQGLALGLLFVREGKLIDRRNFYFSGLEETDKRELLRSFIVQFYTDQKQIPPRLVLPFELEDLEEQQSLTELLTDFRQAKVQISLAKNREEKNLIQIAEDNAIEEAKKRIDNDLSEQLAHIFSSPTPIRSIECVDVSHTSGQHTKVGLVQFLDGKPNKSAYRVYNVENTNGDDYLALAQFAKRRFTSEDPLPDLLLIDGGKGQLSVVEKERAELGVNIILAGIAKARTEDGRSDRRAGNVSDRIFIPNRINHLNLKSGSSVLLYLQLIRDNTHRFAITKHKQARDKATLSHKQ